MVAYNELTSWYILGALLFWLTINRYLPTFDMHYTHTHTGHSGCVQCMVGMQLFRTWCNISSLNRIQQNTNVYNYLLISFLSSDEVLVSMLLKVRNSLCWQAVQFDFFEVLLSRLRELHGVSNKSTLTMQIMKCGEMGSKPYLSSVKF